MANLNKVMLIGNLTRDPDVRYTPKGTAVAEFGLAVNRNWKDESGEQQTEVIFVDITLWARLAEIAGEFLKKGRPVFIEGRLQLESWDDKQTGQKRSKLKVVGENIQMLGGKEEGKNDVPPKSRSASHTPSKPVTKPQRDPDLDVEPDDIPF